MTARTPIFALALLAAATLGGCLAHRYDPAKAFIAYPDRDDAATSIDIQVFRRHSEIEIVNTTPHSYRDINLWINRRYGRSVDVLPAGGTLRLSLWDFRDVRGEVMIAGGIWRTQAPTTVHLVEMQMPDGRMIGLIAEGDIDF